MALATLLAITITCIGWSLWIRRVTWTCRWEVAATLNIALQGAAVLLMSPLASETLGHWLHALTGKWNLEDYIGHDCYIVAASAIVYNTLGRLADDDAMQKSFKQYVERPATLCIPLLLVTFSVGNGAQDLQAGLLHGSNRLLAESVLAVALRHPDLSAGVRHPGHTRVAARTRARGRSPISIWSSSVFGILACVVRITTALVTHLQTVEGGTLVWLFACMCGAGFALASAHSWRIKTKWFTKVSG